MCLPLLLLLLLSGDLFLSNWIRSRYGRASMFRSFPKKFRLLQQALKDSVIGLEEPTFFPKSKRAAWGHHLWKFPLALIQETQLPLLASTPLSSGLLPKERKWLCINNSNSEACNCLFPHPSSDQLLGRLHYGWPQPLLSSPNWWLGGSSEGHSAFSTVITMISKKLRA